jgi:GPH family glycoside/pentoside/hexuronide:cation symporter
MSLDDSIFDPKAWELASNKKMMSYSFGFIIDLYLLSAYNFTIFYFYEVEIGLNVELITIAIMVFALGNILSSPFLGYLTDRSFKWSEKWGFRAPWIIISALPAIIFYLLLYTPPNIDPKTNPWPVFWYLMIISCLFSIFYSLYRQHFYGSFANQFREDFERRRASAIAFLFPGALLFFMSIIPLFIIRYGDKSTFLLSTIITTIILLLCLVILIPGIHESTEVKKRFLQGYNIEQETSFLKMMKLSLGQKNFMTLLCAYTLITISGGLNMASSIYFFKDVLGLPLYLSVYPNIAYYLAVMLSLPLWAIVAARYGNIKTYILGILLSGVSYIPYLWITTLEEVIIFSIVRGLGYSCTAFMVLPILSDTYDEITLICGRHQEATLVGIRNIFIRSSVIFQALIIGGVHLMTGYNNNPNPNTIQTPLAIWGVRVHNALIPMILCFIAGIFMMKGYDLKGEKKILLKENLRKRGL